MRTENECWRCRYYVPAPEAIRRGFVKAGEIAHDEGWCLKHRRIVVEDDSACGDFAEVVPLVRISIYWCPKGDCPEGVVNTIECREGVPHERVCGELAPVRGYAVVAEALPSGGNGILLHAVVAWRKSVPDFHIIFDPSVIDADQAIKAVTSVWSLESIDDVYRLHNDVAGRLEGAGALKASVMRFVMNVGPGPTVWAFSVRKVA